MTADLQPNRGSPSDDWRYGWFQLDSQRSRNFDLGEQFDPLSLVTGGDFDLIGGLGSWRIPQALDHILPADECS